MFVHICFSINKLYLPLVMPLSKCIVSGNSRYSTALVFTQDKTLTSKTNFYNQKTNFPICSNANCLIYDSILELGNLILKMQSRLLWIDSLKTISTFQLYKIKRKFISNTRSM